MRDERLIEKIEMTGTKESTTKKIILVGQPNVGKSVIFNALTGNYVNVSNYPGTTVEVAKGKMKTGGEEFEIIDTPGMYSLLPITEEERVTRSILFKDKPSIVLHVIDAKNLNRMLGVTLQLLEANLPVVLVINIVDEAERVGLKINGEKLQEKLGIPVIQTVATERRNIDPLKLIIKQYKPMRMHHNVETNSNNLPQYKEEIEEAIDKLKLIVNHKTEISQRALALLILQKDEEIISQYEEDNNKNTITNIIKDLSEKISQSLPYLISIERQKKTSELCEGVLTEKKTAIHQMKEKLGNIMIGPITGIPFLLIVVYLLYEFVGVFGAQTLVDFLENDIFGKYINPAVTSFVNNIIPWPVIQDLFVNDYGIITLGIRYAVAIILPIVATFFIAFSIIEDTGYLPRLALLVDKLFKRIGLNGRAVIPIVLGFGCDTMAVMVTRTLETKRERIISTILLSLAIPCSAQMGVILALMAGSPMALLVWIVVMIFIFLLIGFLAAKVIPGEKPMFFMEIPPLRMPKLYNVFTKTYTRVEWYFKEILPLFILASIFIWLGKLTGLFDLVIKILEYPVQLLGLPKESAVAFLYGFFRRDFGAAGLYDLKSSGLLEGIPLVVAVTTLTLFMPCIAQLSMTIKERGLKTSLIMISFIFPFAFIVGYLLNVILIFLGVSL
ncbi:MAG: ferrous iron transport protein B [Bacteroidetes bacterium]|nr:ferrous iron transport protein B [Bacteroidota bacterium]